MRKGRTPCALPCPPHSSDPLAPDYPQYMCRFLDKEMVKMENKKPTGVTLLGKKNVKIPNEYCPEILETFLNKHRENDYFVKFN